jgi:hypothetical protein
MRVTKTVREYIAKQVALRFPKTEIELQQEQNREIVNKANSEYQKRVEKARAEIAKKVAEEFGITAEVAEIKMHYASPFESGYTTTANQANTARFERNKIIKDKVEDIIVTLELGGTKADLEKMLAEI